MDKILINCILIVISNYIKILKYKNIEIQNIKIIFQAIIEIYYNINILHNIKDYPISEYININKNFNEFIYSILFESEILPRSLILSNFKDNNLFTNKIIPKSNIFTTIKHILKNNPLNKNIIINISRSHYNDNNNIFNIFQYEDQNNNFHHFKENSINVTIAKEILKNIKGIKLYNTITPIKRRTWNFNSIKEELNGNNSIKYPKSPVLSTMSNELYEEKHIDEDTYPENNN